jgi:hypothetical protein
LGTGKWELKFWIQAVGRFPPTAVPCIPGAW